MVVEQSKVTQHRVPALDFSTAEQPRPPSAAPSIEQRVCYLRALYAFACRAGKYSRTTKSGDAPRAFDRRGLGTLFLYLAISIVFFGRGLIGQFGSAYVGMGMDPTLMAWFLVWWPHAIANHLNPLLTHAIWWPTGYNLAWSPCLPLVSVLFIPITVTLGPVAAFNTLCLLSLPLDAWCAFTLCTYVTRRYWPSFLGGYIFGFSPYMLGQLIAGHLHMLIVFSVPLAAYLALRRLAHNMERGDFCCCWCC